MRHHFADFLDRNDDYWSMIPNRERFVYRIGNFLVGDDEVKVVTIGRDDKPWTNIFTFPNLEELTLHEPSFRQLEALRDLPKLKRLRITHARPKEISFLGNLLEIEELVLEYVSGISDLGLLSKLPKLRSLHLENLRRVNNFDGLSGINSLRYLRIDGTLDWKQPIENFEFLRGLPNLEVLSFGQIINKTPYPAMLPALDLGKLKRLKLTWSMLAAEEYALLESGLPNVEGARWGPYTKFRIGRGHAEWFEFTGKGAGRVKCGHINAEHRCAEYASKYSLMKAEAERTISRDGCQIRIGKS